MFLQTEQIAENVIVTSIQALCSSVDPLIIFTEDLV